MSKEYVRSWRRRWLRYWLVHGSVGLLRHGLLTQWQYKIPVATTIAARVSSNGERNEDS